MSSLLHHVPPSVISLPHLLWSLPLCTSLSLRQLFAPSFTLSHLIHSSFQVPHFTYRPPLSSIILLLRPTTTSSRSVIRRFHQLYFYGHRVHLLLHCELSFTVECRSISPCFGRNHHRTLFYTLCRSLPPAIDAILPPSLYCFSLHLFTIVSYLYKTLISFTQLTLFEPTHFLIGLDYFGFVKKNYTSSTRSNPYTPLGLMVFY